MITSRHTIPNTRHELLNRGPMMDYVKKLDRGLYLICWAICLFCMAVIIASLSGQIFARYVFNVPLQYTDDMAEISLVWMSFIGAALLFHERGHIAIGIMQELLGNAANAVFRILIASMTIGASALVVFQIYEVMPTMSRITYGSLPTIPYFSKFWALFVPLGLGSLMTIFFAGMNIAQDIRLMRAKRPYPEKPTHIEEGRL